MEPIATGLGRTGETYKVAEVCAYCTGPTTADDRLPMRFEEEAITVGTHTACALINALANLETANPPDTTILADERTNERAHAEGDAMPRPSKKLVERMNAAGYVATAEAAKLTGHGSSTIYHWITKGRVRAVRSGSLYFVSRTDLERECPPVAKGAAR